MENGNEDQKTGLDINRVIFRPFRREDAESLVNTNALNFSIGVLNPSLQHRYLSVTGLIPQEKGLVAHHIEEKRAVGYLQLIKHTASLYSIKYVFTDPSFRRMGIAKGLLRYAFSYAKENGGKKIFLTEGYPRGIQSELYGKMGFRTIVPTSMAYIAGFGKFPLESKDRLNLLHVHSKKDRRKLFSIYERLMGEKWVSFFENNSDNIVKGFSQNFRRFSFKSSFINELENSFAIVSSNPPLLRIASVELYSASDELIPSLLQELFRILHNRGIAYTKITLLNIKDEEFAAKNPYLFNQMDYVFQMMFMGRLL
jgi:ribosomal protein S18 acetylase RimI-like enzyme